MHTNLHGAGRSSFDLFDARELFAELALKPDTVLLDLGCGIGKYTLAAASTIQRPGRIFALDLWEAGIDTLRKSAASRDLEQITAIVADAGDRLPVESAIVDVCLLGTVFHDFVHGGVDAAALQELYRVLRPGGTLAVVEFVKEDGPPGPPLHIRLSPGELRERIEPAKFQQVRCMDLGQHTYLSMFVRGGEA